MGAALFLLPTPLWGGVGGGGVGHMSAAIPRPPTLSLPHQGGGREWGGGPVDRKNAADQVPIDRRMEEHRRRHDEAALAIKDHAGEIARFADDGGVAGAVEMIMHFFHQARDLVAQ